MEPTTITPVAPRSNPYLIPLSIVIAGLIIAGAVYFRGAAAPAANAGPTQKQLAQVSPIGAKDHVRGNPNAKIKIYEYSDLECPFCKEFHKTMRQVVDAYGPTNEVAWIYRNFPITSRHPKAQNEAEAAECVAELGGNDKFWQYIDKIFEVTPANNGLDLTLLPKMATELGIDTAKFNACVASGKYRALIKTQSDEAVKLGGSGTPYAVLVGPKKEYIAIPGAIPFENMKQGIDGLLGKKAE
jgi:protein-disulfide isomerase